MRGHAYALKVAVTTCFLELEMSYFEYGGFWHKILAEDKFHTTWLLRISNGHHIGSSISLESKDRDVIFSLALHVWQHEPIGSR